jgi:hypothetical protein
LPGDGLPDAYGGAHIVIDQAVHEAVRGPMRYRIVAEPRYVRAELFNRRTAAETGQFLGAVAAECVRLKCYRVLISVCSSKPIFTVEKYGLSSFIEIALKYSGQIALLTDSAEMRIAHDYAATLARLRGVNVRTFRDEAAAVSWLQKGRQ